MATKNGIVKSSVIEVIPSSEMQGLENALSELKREAEVLPELKSKIDTLAVVDAQSYADMGNLLTHARSIGKMGALKLNGFLEIAARVTNFLRGERTKHEDAAAIIANTASTKMADYKRREREAAEAEQRRINEQKRIENDVRIAREQREAKERAEEVRKQRVKEINAQLKRGEIGKREAAKLLKEAGADAEARAQQAEAEAEAAKNIAPPQVTVQSNVPKIAGLRARVNWKFRIVDAHKIPRTYLQPDEVAIGQMVRTMKDQEKAQAICPGIEVWTEDAV